MKQTIGADLPISFPAADGARDLPVSVRDVLSRNLHIVSPDELTDVQKISVVLGRLWLKPVFTFQLMRPLPSPAVSSKDAARSIEAKLEGGAEELDSLEVALIATEFREVIATYNQFFVPLVSA